MTSTRLKSEEIYRERVVSDSLFTAPTQIQENTNSNSSSNVNLTHDNQVEESFRYQDDIFDDDVFGPPPLPKSDEKSSKTKVISLFDESDSDDEFLFNTSSKSRTQKSVDVITTSQVQNKSKFPKKINLFDDDDDDIFGVKDSPDVDIFAVDTKPLSSEQDKLSSRKTPGVASDLFGESGKSDSSKIDTPKALIAKTSLKSTSLFDDSDEDEDLFGSNLSRKENKVSSIFDDDTDLPIDPLKLKSSIMGSSLTSIEETKTEIVDEVHDTSQNIFSASKGGLFDNYIEDDDLFGQKITSSEIDENPSKTEVNDCSIFKESSNLLANSELKVESKTPPKIPQKPDDISPRIIQTREKEIKNENVVDGGIISKREPPKTLNIRSSPSPTGEESSQVPRRAVSGKIKDLMGRMGDLKILSPTDAPPVLRKNDEEEESLECDSEDGGSLSIPSSGVETSVSVDNVPRNESPKSSSITEKNTEQAISFDELVHVETLTTASKSRVRIPVKRRPQSRHARQTALRQSGMDFDVMDSSKNLVLDHDGDVKDKNIGPSSEIVNDSNSSSEKLIAPTIKTDKSANSKNTEFNILLTTDDKSERSLSKESTLSANKNTLLSASTDEEDLFDVPPDLPEDPFKEDSLFGRAPILSPVDDVVISGIDQSTIINDNVLPSKLKVNESEKDSINVKQEEKKSKLDQKLESFAPAESKEPNFEDVFSQDEDKKLTLDPLRNSDLDPLKDPSQLFAFVIKTPSPEKGKSLLFNEDDSLFSSTSSQASEKTVTSTKKIDLLFNDAGGDLFSAPLVKSDKKPLKVKKISLFDDDINDDEEDSLFGSTTKKNVEKIQDQKAERVDSEQNYVGQKGIFESDSEEHLFSDGTKAKVHKDGIVSENKSKASNLQDIFGDQSSGEEDIFAFKKTIAKKPATENKSLFDDYDDDDIFAKPSSSVSKMTESRTSVKKVVTRDLKKTAEQIVEDPLSMLQED